MVFCHSSFRALHNDEQDHIRPVRARPDSTQYSMIIEKFINEKVEAVNETFSTSGENHKIEKWRWVTKRYAPPAMDIGFSLNLSISNEMFLRYTHYTLT